MPLRSPRYKPDDTVYVPGYELWAGSTLDGKPVDFIRVLDVNDHHYFHPIHIIRVIAIPDDVTVELSNGERIFYTRDAWLLAFSRPYPVREIR